METPAARHPGALRNLYGVGAPRINRWLALAAITAVTVAAAPPEAGKPPITPQTATSGGPLDPDQRKVTLDSADYRIEVMPDREELAGTGTLAFTAKSPLTRLVIDLDTNLKVRAVAIDGRALPPSAYGNPQGRMTIRLPRRVPAGGTVTATITYAGKPHVAVRPPWQDGIVWAKTKDGRPWVATTAQFSGCDLYFPCIDYPTYEPRSADLRITVPRGLKAISNGVLVGTETLADGRTTWNWHAKRPTLYGMAINVAPYEEVSGSYKSRFGNTIPMHYWYLPGEEKQARDLFAEFSQALNFFESTIGPYPFGDEKVGVVETPHKGMEHQTVNAYGNGYAKSRWGYDELFNHEFSHEWFANQLTVANWDDFWLHEGTGTYMQPLLTRWRRGEGSYTAQMLDDLPRIYARAPLVTGKPQSAGDVYFADTHRGSDIYKKGSWVLHTLRGLIGDAAFFDTLRLAVYGRTDPRPGNFQPLYRTTPEFIAFANRTSGQELQWFFDVYLYSAALPRLIETRDRDRLTLRWQAEGNKRFPMPVEVEVDGRVTRLAMTDGRDTLTLPAGAHVVIDPMSRILRYSPEIEAFGDWGEAQYQAKMKDKN